MTIVADHVALRVRDIEAAISFYRKVFDAQVASRPFFVDAERAGRIFDAADVGSPRMCHLRFEAGIFELFEIPSRGSDDPTVEAWRRNLLHAGLVVDDMEACVDRVVAEGGRVVLPISAEGPHKLAFVADPDGNVLEISDAPIEALIESATAQDPRTDPARRPNE